MEFIRSKGRRRKGGVTPAQEVQRAKFALVQSFLRTMNPLLQVSFNNFSQKMTGPNHALAYTLKHAVAGTYPNLRLHYPSVLVSRGSNLTDAYNATATAGPDATVQFTWEDNTGVGTAKAGDRSILVVHCPQRMQTMYTVDGPPRSAGSGSLRVHFFRGMELHTWLSFLSENGTDAATSVYTGSLTVS